MTNPATDAPGSESGPASDGASAEPPLQPPSLDDYDPLPEEQPDERIGTGSGAEPREQNVLRQAAEADRA